MKCMIITAGALGVVLSLGSVFAAQPSSGRKFSSGDRHDRASPALSHTPHAEAPPTESGNGGSSPQAQELSRRRLAVGEAERQSRGEAKEDEAIQAQERVFNDAESWRDFWSSYGDVKVPEVDFASSRVAAVFLGARPSPGYGVEISKIIYHPGKRLTVIHVVELLPDPQMSYLALLVYPADIVVFPAKPGQVRFARKRRVRAGRP